MFVSLAPNLQGCLFCLHPGLFYDILSFPVMPSIPKVLLTDWAGKPRHHTSTGKTPGLPPLVLALFDLFLVLKSLAFVSFVNWIFTWYCEFYHRNGHIVHKHSSWRMFAARRQYRTSIFFSAGSTSRFAAAANIFTEMEQPVTIPISKNCQAVVNSSTVKHSLKLL